MKHLHVIPKDSDVALCGETREGGEIVDGAADSSTPWCDECLTEHQRLHGRAYPPSEGRS